jgi:hypothetical protein
MRAVPHYLNLTRLNFQRRLALLLLLGLCFNWVTTAFPLWPDVSRVLATFQLCTTKVSTNHSLLIDIDTKHNTHCALCLIDISDVNLPLAQRTTVGEIRDFEPILLAQYTLVTLVRWQPQYPQPPPLV